MIQKLAYIWYPTTNMNRAVEFYHLSLGFKLLFKRDDWSEFDIGGQRLALRKVDILQEDNHSSTPGVSFLAQPIEQVIADLAQKGILLARDLEVYPHGKMASFQDPDGNILGLYEPPPQKGA